MKPKQIETEAVEDSTPAASIPDAENETPEADVDELTDELLEDRPEPSAHFDPANVPGQATVNSPDATAHSFCDKQGRPLVDRHGDTFDPEKHLVGEDGKPKLTKSGKLRMKIGRPPAGNKTGKSDIKSARDLPRGGSRIGGVADAGPSPGARVGGKAAANLLFTAGMALGGEEWQPRIEPEIGLNEPQMIETAFADYFEATGMDDLPPGWALAAALGMYALPRLQQPKTRTRLQLFKAWMANKFNNRKRKNGARNDSRNDGKRENLAGEKPRAVDASEGRGVDRVRSN